MKKKIKYIILFLTLFYPSSGNFEVTANTIQETFPRSLLKTNDNAAIYWLARYENSGDYEAQGGDEWYARWLTRDANDVSGTGAANQVASISVAMTLALHRIKNDHSAKRQESSETDYQASKETS